MDKKMLLIKVAFYAGAALLVYGYFKYRHQKHIENCVSEGKYWSTIYDRCVEDTRDSIPREAPKKKED